MTHHFSSKSRLMRYQWKWYLEMSQMMSRHLNQIQKIHLLIDKNLQKLSLNYINKFRQSTILVMMKHSSLSKMLLIAFLSQEVKELEINQKIILLVIV